MDKRPPPPGAAQLRVRDYLPAAIASSQDSFLRHLIELHQTVLQLPDLLAHRRETPSVALPFFLTRLSGTASRNNFSSLIGFFFIPLLWRSVVNPLPLHLRSVPLCPAVSLQFGSTPLLCHSTSVLPSFCSAYLLFHLLSTSVDRFNIKYINLL